MINLLYFIPSLSTSGGMERVLCEKVNYLESTGNYNIFVVTTEMKPEQSAFFRLNEGVNLIHLELNYNGLFYNGFLKKVIGIYNLNKIYKENIKRIVSQYSIHICVTMGGKELEFIGKLNLSCKIIYESHFNKNFRSSFLLAHGRNNFLWQLVGRFRDLQHNFQVLNINKVVVLTRENLIAWSSISNKVQLIPNPSPLTNAKGQMPNIDSKKIIAIGKLDVQKGYDLLIDAWSMVTHKHLGWSLDIYGQGGLQTKLQTQIDNLNLQSTVFLRGITKNVDEELFKSAFFVMSSRFEGLPMVLIESLTCGLPIVSFDCETGPREIIENDDCGILVENGDIYALAEAMEKMMLDIDYRATCSRNALEKSKKYELTNIMKVWEELFKEILN